MKKIRLVGVDDWYRPIYQDEDGRLWKDVNLGIGTPYLHDVADNDIDGEPNMPIKSEYKIIE